MNIKTVSLIFTILFFFFQSNAQESYIKEAYKNEVKKGDKYYVTIPAKKTIKREKIEEYCNKNNFICSDYTYKYVSKFGGVVKSVESFLIISELEQKKIDEIKAVKTAEDVATLSKRYPNEIDRIENELKGLVFKDLRVNIYTSYCEYVKSFPSKQPQFSAELKTAIERDASLIPTKITDLINSVAKSKGLVIIVNPQEYTNQAYLLNLKKELTASKLFDEDIINALLFKLLDKINKFDICVSKEYELRELNELIKGNPAEADFTRYELRFPKSEYLKQLAQEYKKVDDKNWESIKNSNRVDDYQKYLDRFKKGTHSKEAKLKIAEINRKIEAEAAARQEKERRKQQEINRIEEQRIRDIKTADIGDHICFTYRYIDGFLGIKTEDYEILVVCSIEARNKDKYKVTVVDYLVPKYKYPDRNIKIDGVSFSKDDTRWIKPLDDDRWRICD